MSRVRIDKSIRTQLLVSFFFIVLLMVLVGIASIYHVRRVYRNGNTIYMNNLQTVDYLKTMHINIKLIDKCLLGMVKDIDKYTVDEYISQIENIQEQNTQLMYKYENLDYDKEEKQIYDQCRIKIIDFNKYTTTIIGLVEEGKLEEAHDVYSEDLIPLEKGACEKLEEVTDYATEHAENSNEDNYNSYRRVVMAIVVTMILTTVLAVLISIRVSNSFTDKLNVIQRWAKRISEYNVSEDITEVGKDEFGVTTKALNDSQFMIRDLVEKIMEESAMISDTGKEVSDAIRKSKKRMENINLSIMESEKLEQGTIEAVKSIMMHKSIPDDLVEELKNMLANVEKSIEDKDSFQEQIADMTTYMEQIAITSDYQNQIAMTHRNQVGKFKVKKDE